MSDFPFEDSLIGAPTPAPKAPHVWRLRAVSYADGSVKRVICINCGKGMNDGAGEYCTAANTKGKQ